MGDTVVNEHAGELTASCCIDSQLKIASFPVIPVLQKVHALFMVFQVSFSKRSTQIHTALKALILFSTLTVYECLLISAHQIKESGV